MSSPHPVFGFGNPETHLLLIWPTEHSGADLKALVAPSMDEVEHDNTYRISGDVSSSCRDVLARKLEDTLSELTTDHTGRLADDPPSLDGSLSPLTANLLALAVGCIDTERVATAVLRFHRKWSPDNSVPEISE